MQHFGSHSPITGGLSSDSADVSAFLSFSYQAGAKSFMYSSGYAKLDVLSSCEALHCLSSVGHFRLVPRCWQCTGPASGRWRCLV
jgi:hypothetical protein